MYRMFESRPQQTYMSKQILNNIIISIITMTHNSYNNNILLLQVHDTIHTTVLLEL